MWLWQDASEREVSDGGDPVADEFEDDELARDPLCPQLRHPAIVEETCHNAAMTILEGPIRGAERTEVGGLTVDDVVVGTGHLKRLIYPPGWRWSTHMRPVTGGEMCMHAHVGMLVQGRIAIEYADGCREEFEAPAAVAVVPGHDGWVVGDEPAVLVQYDCGPATVERLGLPSAHTHDG